MLATYTRSTQQVRVPKRILRKFKTVANKERRSLHEMVSIVLEDWLVEHQNKSEEPKKTYAQNP